MRDGTFAMPEGQMIDLMFPFRVFRVIERVAWFAELHGCGAWYRGTARCLPTTELALEMNSSWGQFGLACLDG